MYYLDMILLPIYLKAIHIITMVAWFAGLFYIGRIFVYLEQANQEEEPRKSILIDQFNLMAKRVWYGIILPSLFITVIFGSWLAIYIKAFLMPWFHLKLLLIILFISYNHYIGKIRKQFLNNSQTLSSFKLRFINEIPALFLIAIVFVVYLKDMLNEIWGISAMISIGIIFALAIKKGLKKSSSKS